MPRFVPYGIYPLTLAVVLIVAWAVAAGIAPWPLLPAVVAAAIVAIALLERRFPFEAAWLQDQGDLRADIVHAVVNWGLLSGAGWAVHTVVHAILGPGVLWPTAWPVASQLLLVALVVDIGLYAMHVASHRWPWAWRLHAVHHSAERLYWLNGERRHPLSALLMGGPGLLALAALGAPPTLVSAWLAVVAVHLAFQHANLDYRLGPLRRWIAGAETHRWHHKREYEDAQVNFGEVFLVWDRLFGTFLDETQRLAPDAVGLRGRTAPASYVRQLAWPFQVPRPLRAAFDARLRSGHDALSRGELSYALAHLEAAHILGQGWTGLHVRSHVALLRWGWRAGQPREVAGQGVRIVASALMTWLWMPTGNPGSTRAKLLERRPIAHDLAPILGRSRG
jgi:sterol desaturase/sphingolipid hydroxylase (fatty acid hydroxylase superfamily)